MADRSVPRPFWRRVRPLALWFAGALVVVALVAVGRTVF